MDWGTVLSNYVQDQVIPATVHIVLILILAWLVNRLLVILVRRVQSLVEDDGSHDC